MNGNKDPFQGKKVKYPVSYPLKVITTISKPQDVMKAEILQILHKLSIPARETKVTPSSKGNYLSFTIFVTLINEESLKLLYAELATIKEIKMAI